VQVCESDDVWQQLYLAHNERRDVDIAADLRSHAQRVGWRRVFFANKLQLQVGLSTRSGRSSFCEPEARENQGRI